MGSPSAAEWTLGAALRPGLEAIRRFWAPFLAIQLAAAALVVGYYQSDSVRVFADQIGRIKSEWGLGFSAVGGFVAGGLIPEVAKALTGRIGRLDRRWLGNTCFNGFVYLVVASQVDLFYRFQSFAFGDGIDAGTILLKTTVDMGLFAPFLCMPTGVVLCDWRDAKWSLVKTVQRIGRAWFRDRVIPAILPGWAFWIPFLLALYALPQPLQMPFALLGEAAWSIIFIFIATQGESGLSSAESSRPLSDQA